MHSALSRVSIASLAVLSAACASAPALRISALPEGGAEGAGIPFVVPRTVIRVETDKPGPSGRIVFTPVPVAYAEDGKSALPRFLASGAGGPFALTPTTVTSVKYADELIVKAIGTQVADYRKDAVGALAGSVALAGAFAPSDDCASAPPLRPFVIATLAPASYRAPNNGCWGYSIEPAAFAPAGMRAYPVSGLAAAGTVGWFPIAACRPYVVKVFQCRDAACTAAPDSVATAVLSASDGTRYRRVPLPARGSVTLHPDFCQADITNGSVGGDDWNLLRQVLSDVKAAAK